VAAATQVEVVLLEAAFRAHLDYVAEALGGDEGRARAAPLDQRVGGKRGAVDHEIEVGRSDACSLDDDCDAIEDRLLGRGVVRQHLARIHLPATVECDSERCRDVAPSRMACRLVMPHLVGRACIVRLGACLRHLSCLSRHALEMKKSDGSERISCRSDSGGEVPDFTVRAAKRHI
jgi:hypothetical protein